MAFIQVLEPGRGPPTQKQTGPTLEELLMTVPLEKTVIFRMTLSLWVLALASCSGGETPPSTGLEAGQYARLELEAQHPEPFSFLNTIRERSDGTVLAADPLSQVVLRLDLTAGVADTLGRVGEGPEEYMQPDQVFPLPADSTLLVDIGKMQFTIIDPEGGFHSGRKLAAQSDNGRMEFIMPRLVDGEGRIYHTASGGLGQEGPQDSTLVVRFDRRTGETEEMGWVWRPAPIVTRSGDNVRSMSVQMSGRDDWAVGDEGAFAIVRAADYSVEWHYPDGRVVKGPPNPWERRSITEDDKLAFLENRSSGGLMVAVSQSSSGGTEMRMSRGGGGMRPEWNLQDFQWAEEFAPFRPDRSRVSPAGHLWVTRWLPEGEAPRVDVFDGQGERLGGVDLPADRELIGFGTTADGSPAVYLVRTDEFDLRWLERYRIVR